MVRIDPIAVLESYQATQVLPTRFSDFCYPDMYGRIRCCPFAACALAAKGKRESDFGPVEFGLTANLEFAKVMSGSAAEMNEAMGISRKLLDVTRAYQVGFIYGYDWWPIQPPLVLMYSPDYDIGLADGGSARAVLAAMDFRLD